MELLKPNVSDKKITVQIAPSNSVKLRVFRSLFKEKNERVITYQDIVNIVLHDVDLEKLL